MPISNEQARELAERVWSDAVPPHTSELAEAIIDVLDRVAELETAQRPKPMADALRDGTPILARDDTGHVDTTEWYSSPDIGILGAWTWANESDSAASPVDFVDLPITWRVDVDG